MAILGSIRKRPIFLILIIGLALFAFVLSKVLRGNSNPVRNSIGTVAGKKINREDFTKRVEAQRNGRANSSRIQNVNTVWNQVVRENVYETQIEKAGIVIGEEDIWNTIIKSLQNNPNFKNEDGLFDEEKVKEYIATLKSNKNTSRGAAAWKQWTDYEKSVKENLKRTAYDNLIKVGLTASLKDGENQYNLENTKFDVNYVYEPYSSIKNTDITISDADISNYISNHAEEFKVEASREIEYVNFEVKPSAEDIAIYKDKISSLLKDRKEIDVNTNEEVTLKGFKDIKDNTIFVTEYSDIPYVDKIYFSKDLPTGIYDSLVKLPNNTVIGPIKDGDYFKLFKKLDAKAEKSVKSSHILISYKGSQSRNNKITRTKEEAEAFANELLKKVNKANFAAMAKTNSDDSSATNGGSLGGFVKESEAKFVKPFNDFIFANKKGKIGIVETAFGYHLIKIDDVKLEDGLKLAIVAQKIDPSKKTESDIYQNVETLASNLDSGKDMDELAKTNNYTVKKANNIKLLSENISGLGNQRDIVKWTFEKENKIGAVKRFELANGNYAVVKLVNKVNAGTESVASAKSKVTTKIENSKKAKLLKNKMQGSTINDIASVLNKKVNTSNNVSINNPNLNGVGSDKIIIGSLYYMAENKVNIVEGKNGVIAIQVIKKTPAMDIKNYNSYTNILNNTYKNKASKVFDAMKNIVTIEDYRAEFY